MVVGLNTSRSYINTEKYPVFDQEFLIQSKRDFDRDGALVFDGFLTDEALSQIQREAQRLEDRAYFCVQNHSVFLTPIDENYSVDHPKNLQVVSSKGCVCDDEISKTSPLRVLYDDRQFCEYLCFVLGEKKLFPYADPLSSINIHYATTGQELGWHFDNSSFAITILIEKPEGGGQFEYVKNLRDADNFEHGFDDVKRVLEGTLVADKLDAEPGTLMLFRGKNSIHRVTPTIGNKTRKLAVLAYNSEPGVSLSPAARKTFYGRLN